VGVPTITIEGRSWLVRRRLEWKSSTHQTTRYGCCSYRNFWRKQHAVIGQFFGRFFGLNCRSRKQANPSSTAFGVIWSSYRSRVCSVNASRSGCNNVRRKHDEHQRSIHDHRFEWSRQGTFEQWRNECRHSSRVCPDGRLIRSLKKQNAPEIASGALHCSD
jgi:hypothetical protein